MNIPTQKQSLNPMKLGKCTNMALQLLMQKYSEGTVLSALLMTDQEEDKHDIKLKYKQLTKVLYKLDTELEQEMTQ